MAKVQNWGNSQGVRLSKRILEDAGISVGDEVDVVVQNGVILIMPLQWTRGKISLRDLVSRIPKRYRMKEVDWGKLRGREVW